MFFDPFHTLGKKEPWTPKITFLEEFQQWAAKQDIAWAECAPEDIRGLPFEGVILDDEVVVRVPNFPDEFKLGEFDSFEEV